MAEDVGQRQGSFAAARQGKFRCKARHRRAERELAFGDCKANHGGGKAFGKGGDPKKCVGIDPLAAPGFRLAISTQEPDFAVAHDGHAEPHEISGLHGRLQVCVQPQQLRFGNDRRGRKLRQHSALQAAGLGTGEKAQETGGNEAEKGFLQEGLPAPVSVRAAG